MFYDQGRPRSGRLCAMGILLSVLALVGCSNAVQSGNTGAHLPDGRPVTDDMIRARIEALPGVLSLTLTYDPNIDGSSYDAKITEGPGSDTKATVETVGKMLWNAGHTVTYIAVSVECPQGCAVDAFTLKDLGIRYREDRLKAWGPSTRILA